MADKRKAPQGSDAARKRKAPTIDLTGVNSSGDPKRGFMAFHQNCQVCHGANASGAYLPDLKRSQALLSPESWKGVVIDGALAPNGMASFSRFLDAKDAEDIRAYLLSEARKGAPAAGGGAKGPA